jgi:hypothetical protein
MVVVVGEGIISIRLAEAVEALQPRAPRLLELQGDLEAVTQLLDLGAQVVAQEVLRGLKQHLLPIP